MGTRKKDLLRGSFFSYRPSAGAAPWSVPTQQTVYVDPLRGSFFSYRPSAGAAPRSVSTQQTVYIVAPTLQLLTISLAKSFLSNTTRQGMASCPSVSAHPANRIRCSSNIAIADHFLQSNSTSSFKHHWTGEAWPACRAIIPFHSNTTRQAK